MKCPHMLFLPLSQLQSGLCVLFMSIFTRAEAALQAWQPTWSRAQAFQLVSWWSCTGIPIRYGFHHKDVGICNVPGRTFPSNAALWNESSDSFETTKQNNEHCWAWLSRHLASMPQELPVWWSIEPAKHIFCLQALPLKGTVLPILSCPHWKPGWEMYQDLFNIVYPGVLSIASWDYKWVWFSSRIFLSKLFKQVATHC